MSETAIYRDNFSKSFTEEEALLDFLHEREQNATWTKLPTRDVRFQSLDKDSMTGQMLVQSYKMLGKEDLMEDTISNTQLLLMAEEQIIPVRSCAISSILGRARIGGHALNKVKKDVLAEILNHCVSVANGDALLRISDDKVSAMHGGDESDYAILEMPALVECITNRLTEDFSSYKLASSYYDHSILSIVWTFPDNPELLDAYEEAASMHGIRWGDFCPAVRFTTSNVGQSGANLFPQLHIKSSGKTVMLGSAIKLEHKWGHTLEDFNKGTALLYARYGDAIDDLIRLMDTDIEHPYNTLLRVMKSVCKRVTKKHAYQIAETWVAQNGENSISTAHDLYFYLSEASFLAQCDGADGSRVAGIEEDIAKALKIKWSDYDIPGTVKW